MIELFVNKYLKDKKVNEYTLEGVSIDTNIELQTNEVVFITSFFGSNFKYISADEYFQSNAQNKITQNLGFIRFVEGSAFLEGIKLTITKYSE